MVVWGAVKKFNKFVLRNLCMYVYMCVCVYIYLSFSLLRSCGLDFKFFFCCGRYTHWLIGSSVCFCF